VLDSRKRFNNFLKSSHQIRRRVDVSVHSDNSKVFNSAQMMRPQASFMKLEVDYGSHEQNK
jgi:hypothetical protein